MPQVCRNLPGRSPNHCGITARPNCCQAAFDIMASSTQISYECFDELIEQLRAAGHASTADKLNFMLHRVAWTTVSELLGELGGEILRFQQSTPSASVTIQQSVNRSLDMVRRVWPEIA